MKKNIFAVFADIDVADEAINHLHNKVGIPAEEISYVYRDKDGEKVSGSGDDVASSTPAEGAKTGAVTGGAIGAAIGLIGAIGMAGPLGAVFVTGPIATALGITGAVGVTAASGVAGAAVGGLIGALTNMGVSEPKARNFEERVGAGYVLVAVHTDKDEEVIAALNEYHAEDMEIVEEVV